MNEIWKDIYFEEDGIIYDYRGLYKVSNTGRIKSLDKETTNGNGKYILNGKILKAHKNEQGYLRIILWKDGKRKLHYIHRLVAYMFIENDDYINKIQVNHKDENKENNCVENLEWCNREYNCNYGTRNERLSEINKNKPQILVERWDKNGNLIDIKNRLEYVKMGFDDSSISKCCKNKIKSVGTGKGTEKFIFKYHEGDKNESK